MLSGKSGFDDVSELFCTLSVALENSLQPGETENPVLIPTWQFVQKVTQCWETREGKE